MDSSIRFHSDKFDDALRLADKTGGPVLFDGTGHSIFAATHAALYEYLPADRTVAIETWMFGAGAMLVYRNREVSFYKNLCLLQSNM